MWDKGLFLHFGKVHWAEEHTVSISIRPILIHVQDTVRHLSIWILPSEDIKRKRKKEDRCYIGTCQLIPVCFCEMLERISPCDFQGPYTGGILYFKNQKLLHKHRIPKSKAESLLLWTKYELTYLNIRRGSFTVAISKNIIYCYFF